MKGPADSPTISLTNENFRAAETWEYAVDAPASAITAGVPLLYPGMVLISLAILLDCREGCL